MVCCGGVEVRGGGRVEVTALLQQWRSGDPAATDQLVPLIYDALRRLAHAHMNREQPGHLMQTTALVHEAYLRLLGNEDLDWQSRAHFFAVTAQVMRRTLVDYARQRGAAKRGGHVRQTTRETDELLSPARAAEVIALDDGLAALRRDYPRACDVVELRYFGGFSNPEIAELLAISEATVQRDWRFAKAWLYRELQTT